MRHKKIRLIIHGGCGRFESSAIQFRDYRASLKKIVQTGYSMLEDGATARETVIQTIKLLEDDPLYNAGTGSKIQADGVVRMTAAIIDSQSGIFSGVMNIEDVQYPIQVADLLSLESHSLLAGALATEFARSKKIPHYNPITELRLNEYKTNLKGQTGTVGAVALDSSGKICAGTSTGGIGGEIPGRVSDSATVAGTYASSECGVSCTGMGEHITRMAVAARMVTMAEDGRSLEKAANIIIRRANNRKFRFGFISLDNFGHWFAAQTRRVRTLYAVHDGTTVLTF